MIISCDVNSSIAHSLYIFSSKQPPRLGSLPPSPPFHGSSFILFCLVGCLSDPWAKRRPKAGI